jgi:outer membrane protein OmpA-like peptidoglycan-associated protein
MKKYKASQNSLAQARTDSAQLAQQVASLNGNVQELTGKNTTLQSSLDSSRSQYTAQQKSMEYYQNYYKEGQDTLAAVNQDVQNVLSQAGITNGDVQQHNDAIYVRLDENDVFKKNSTAVSATGQKVLDGIAQVVVNRPDANVTVGTGDSAIGMAEPMPVAEESPKPRHHHHVSHAATSGNSGAASASSNGSGNGSVAANNSSNGSGASGSSEPAHKKVHHHYSSEGGMSFTSKGHHPGWSLKQGRMVAVANHFLKNGVSKVNVSLQRPPMNGAPGTAIKIIIRPNRREFTPRNASAMAGTE